MSDVLIPRIKQRLADVGITANAASLRISTNRMLITDIITGRSKSPKEATLRKISSVLDCDIGYLLGEQNVPRVDGTHRPASNVVVRPKTTFTVNPHQIEMRGTAEMPIYGLAVGGEDGRFLFNGEVVGRTKVPPVLAGINNAYGLYVAGESMEPRYMPGEEVWINPHKTAVPGDDVIVQLYPEHDGDAPEGLIKRFLHWTPKTLVLWQWNPAEEVVIERQLVKSIHVIVGRG